MTLARVGVPSNRAAWIVTLRSEDTCASGAVVRVMDHLARTFCCGRSPQGGNILKYFIFCMLAAGLAGQLAAADRVDSAVRAEINQSGQARVTILFDIAQADIRSVETRAERRQQIRNVGDELIAAAGEGFRLHRRFRLVAGIVGTVDAPALARLERHRAVRAIGADPGGRGHLDVARPLLGIDVVQAAPPAGLGVTGENVKVVVMDSGIDLNNADFTGAVVDEACFCLAGGSGCCPDGNTTQLGAGAAMDDHGHGTWVSGHVLSRGVDGPRGAAPDASLVAVKVLDSNNSFCCASDVTAAYDWIADNHADAAVLNSSLGTSAVFGGECSEDTAWLQAMAAAVAEVSLNGTLMTASSGNQESVGSIEAPSCLGDVMAVGATYKEDIGGTVNCSTPQPSPSVDEVACFSNVSTELEILAPGAFMDTTALGGGTIVGLAGTSFAAPLVAGCAALIKAARPTASDTEIRADLLARSVQVTDERIGLTFPRLDCLKAVEGLVFRDRFEAPD